MSQCTELSFVETPEDGDRTFWSVDHSGDHREQVERGQLMALEALDVMARDDEGALRHHLLAWVALDMAASDEGKGVKIGFMICMGAFAVAAQEHHGDAWFRQYLAESYAAFDAILASEKSRRSEQARNAANARWAKAKAGEARP